MANNSDDVPIPPDADKLLFAEDLVNHVMHITIPEEAHRRWGSFVNRAEPFRHLIHNGFNETVTKAIDIIDAEQDPFYAIDCLKLVEKNRIILNNLTEYANKYRARHFPNVFHPAHFLVYCTLVAHSASYYFLHAIDGAPDRAIDLIVSAFPEGDTSREIWDTLNSAAELYVRVEEDFSKELTPRDTPSVSSEDSD